MLQRHLVMLGLVAERARHAAAGRIEGLDLEAGHELQRRGAGAGGGEGLLVAMRVQHRFARRAARAAARSGRPWPRRRRIPRRAWRCAASARGSRRPAASAQQLVAQGQEARRLEPDDRHARGDVRRQRRDQAPRLARAPRRPGRRVRKVRPQQSGRPCPSRRDHVVAGARAARARRRAAFSGSNQRLKRIDEEHDGAARRRARGCRRDRASASAAACAARRSRATRSPSAARPGTRLRRLSSARARRGARRIARQIGDQPVAQRERMGLAILRAGTRSSCAPCRRRPGIRACSPCTRCRAPWCARMSSETSASRPELSRQREAQRVGAAARDVLLVEGGAVGRAHHARIGLAAGAVVVAHLDRAGEAAPLRPVERPRPRPRSRSPAGSGRASGRPSAAAARSCRD